MSPPPSPSLSLVPFSIKEQPLSSTSVASRSQLTVAGLTSAVGKAVTLYIIPQKYRHNIPASESALSFALISVNI